MDEWDESFKKHELLEKFPEENGMEREINYYFLKMPLFMTNREFVNEKKTWKEYNGNPQNLLTVYQFTTHPKYPVKEDPIRAETLIGGLYLKEVSPQETLLYLINNSDIKITTGKDLINSKTPGIAKDFVINLVKYLDKH